MKNYTCNDYRQEMILLALKQQLVDSDLSQAQKERLQEQVRQIEAEMDLS
jgi:hypothetical protein